MALDAVLPPRCLGCGETVEATGGLCGSCWSGLTFIDHPRCACCGAPFDYDVGGEALCGACARERPAFDRARAALSYDDASRGLVLGFKHGDQLHAATAFAGWMARAGADAVARADIIAPVPLHRWRLWRRRYNQSALLALAIGRLAGKSVEPALLARRRATPTQAGRSRSGRARNVRGAFAVRPAFAESVKGRSILLVDDVLTTGATVEECARVLKRAGAAEVGVLTLARVQRPVL